MSIYADQIVQSYELDSIDLRLLQALAAAPRAGLLSLARDVGVARNTAQAHLDRLLQAGVITGFGPEVDLRRVGYAVSAFVNLQISQGRSRSVGDALVAVPEVIEAWMTTGPSDLICRVVARDNDHLGELIADLLEIPGVTRTTTSLMLATPIPSRKLALVTGRAS
ncbi:MAG TPA: Lrp/AsnC family transcriptional regulator [Acidimicrobiales bacterium]|nr:Lrp/AsnC family transcriptional regulator [Acidimicrobiales bacterium]